MAGIYIKCSKDIGNYWSPSVKRILSEMWLLRTILTGIQKLQFCCNFLCVTKCESQKMPRKKAQLFWDILYHLNLSRCVCGECYDYYQKCHNSLPHCVIVWVLWCEDSSASAVRYSEYYPPPAHNYFSLHFPSNILRLWIFNVRKVELTFFLRISPQFDILNCDICNIPPFVTVCRRRIRSQIE